MSVAMLAAPIRSWKPGDRAGLTPLEVFGYVWATRPRWQKTVVHAFWIVQTFGVLLFTFAPVAAAEGVDSILSFTGIPDSSGVRVADNMYIRADASALDWNGVLPEIHPERLGNIGTNVVGEFWVSLTKLIVGLGGWLVMAAKSAVFNKLFGEVFKAIGWSFHITLSSTPLMLMALSMATLVGVAMIAFGRIAAGRTTIIIAWLLGTVGLLAARGLLGDLIAPQGWMTKVRTVADGFAGTLIRQGNALSSGTTVADQKYGTFVIALADALVRNPFQVWMLGRAVGSGKGITPAAAALGEDQRTDALCAAAWDAGMKSHSQAKLVTGLANNCPKDIVEHMTMFSSWDGLIIAGAAVLCMGVATWWAFCALKCLFYTIGTGAFAEAFIIVGLIPGWLRRFLGLVSIDFATQIISYALYTILSSVYVLVLGVCFKLQYKAFGVDFVIARIFITAVVMVLFFTLIRHWGKLYRQAIGLPGSGLASATAPVKAALSAAGAGAAFGLAGASAMGRAGGVGASAGGQVNNANTNSRIGSGMRASMQAAAGAMSFAHPGAAALGAMAGGFGSAGLAAFGGGGGKSTASAEKDKGGLLTKSPGGSGAGGGRGSSAAQQAQSMRADREAADRIRGMTRPAGGPGGSTRPPAHGGNSGSGMVK
ncbi:hypothetical protein [Mycobacteroides abscessus]|uniref:hypothetical protein n=1 Tax=Mycobacteroides abscessus TaxID=36809 RepID=UPI00092800B1|nr:hypothetical protein [Mycobacteroides abscessus]SIA42038.1 Uncharacterised protein [Mycobacteroides abscessus subsp. abscessus]SIA57007.1 Uncharacterised protein [Mycobacteroides abscessus subsp. abscessus]SKQ74875.1 Uncharacterised protein [Mycobacteroides abscessus subsp. massiliense]